MSRKSTFFAWGLCGLVACASLTNLADGIRTLDPAVRPLKQGGDLMWNLLSLEFGILAALILWKQPGNRVGWLLMIPALATIPDAVFTIAGVQVPDVAPTSHAPLLMLALWYGGWSWVPAIFSILLLPLLFPTGQPPSRRWRWVLIYGLVLAAVFFLLVTFVERLQDINGEVDWTIANPIGFIPSEWLNSGLFGVTWGLNLALLTLLSFVGLVARYRGAASRERQQIKLLMYACGVFAAVYVVGVALNQDQDGLVTDVWGLMFAGGIAAIPAVMTYSILRYKLFDIDLVIRRTLVYAIVTALLALVFSGGVLLLQRLFTGITGQVSPVAIVASTLAIAALFSPLRRRVQDFVDRRFYRRKYDAEQVLAHFGKTARDETDPDPLIAELVLVVEQAIQPKQVSVWLRSSRDYRQWATAADELPANGMQR